jgi:predicted nicotinamide N-methyase
MAESLWALASLGNSDGPTLEERANALAEAGNFEAAVELFELAVQYRPLATTFEAMAQCLLELDRAADAERAALSAVHADSAWAFGWLTLGRASLNAGNFGEARQALIRACMITPSLAADAEADIATAERLLLEQDEREMTVDGALLRLSQWREQAADGSRLGGGCSSCFSLGVNSSIIDGLDGDSRGTGTMIWECGIVLAKYLEQRSKGSHGGWLRGKRVLELGSGTGVAGLAAAALGATVTLTDLPAVVPLLQSNERRNHEAILAKGGETHVCELDWARECERASAGISWDVVIGADLLYTPGRVQLDMLTATLRRLFEDGSAAQLLLAHKSRHASLDADLLGALDAIGLVARPVPLDELDPEHRSPRILVYDCALRSAS